MYIKKNIYNLKKLKNAKRHKIYFLIIFIIAIFIYSSFFFQSYLPSEHKILRLPDKSLKESIEITKGDNLFSLLSPYDLGFAEIKNMVNAAEPYINLANLRLGQKWNIYSSDEKGKKIFKNLQIQISKDSWLKITKSENGEFTIKKILKPLIKKYEYYSVPIESTLLQSALKHNVPYQNIIQSINAHSYDVDFQRDVKDGSKYDVIVEKFIDPDDLTEEYGKTIFSSVKLKDKSHEIYLTKLTDGQYDYATSNYTTIKKSLLKTPVQATRISSKYGMRKHPVLGYSKMHRGIDFAAPPGTPIYAAGDGTVVALGRKGGYGRYIRIKHNGRISTAYAHLLSYAKGLRKGQKVKQGQVIGKVGASGRATGPHLHYEVLINGKHVNPLSIKSQPSRKLNQKEITDLTTIKNIVANILSNSGRISENNNSNLAAFYETK